MRKSQMNQPISSLDLTDNIIGRLQKNGFHYCHDFKENCENIPQKIHVSNWPSLTEAPSSKTALELLREEIHWQPITTFVPELDSLLKHEISPNMITELSGFPGTGKTQICFHLSVGVNEGETFFISTNKNFASHRLREIAQKYVSDMESALKRIYCVEATDPVELLASVKFLESWLPSHNHVRLLIIDSISWPLKQKPHTERASLIHTIFQNLRILANKYKFAIVITNDLTTKVTGSRVYNSSAFGDGFYHAVNNRILLSKENNLFKAKILKSVHSGLQEAYFKF